MRPASTWCRWPDYTERRHRYAGRGDRDHRDHRVLTHQISVQFNSGQLLQPGELVRSDRKSSPGDEVTQWSLTPALGEPVG